MRLSLRIAGALTLLVHLGFSQGSVLLVGGGSENYNDWSDAPYRWLVEHAPNRHIIILHYSTASTFLPGYFQWLGATSATNLVISSTATANDSSTRQAILAANGIFLRGGDQYQYIQLWRGTLAEDAIKQVFRRGGVVGGTSAGMAVLTQVIFDARITSVDPRSALRNPLASGISFTEDFLGLVPGILGDTHFFERGRLGRLLAMLAVYKSQSGKEIKGVGVDYSTALAIDSAGTGLVMGAGTVTVLGFGPATTCLLDPGKPLAMSNIRMDQLTDGYRIMLANGQIEPPPTAVSYAREEVSFPDARLLLDGSGSPSDWSAPSGSLEKFLTFLPGSGDTVGIVSSASMPGSATSVASFLSQKGVPYRTLRISGEVSNDPSFAGLFNGCAGFVFVANREDSLAGFFDGTLVGTIFSARLGQHTPVLTLSNDSKFAADSGVGRTEYHAYAAYYGYLTRLAGLGMVRGIEVMPRAYESSDSIDNRFSGLFWGMGRSRRGYGLLLDAGTHVMFSHDGRLVSAGKTPTLIVDARGVTSLDFPSFRDPGKVSPRQNAALVGAVIHVVADGQLFDFVTGSVAGVREGSRVDRPGFSLLQSYPNPFNASTNFKFRIPKYGMVTLSVYDLLGRKVATLVNRYLDPGNYSATFDGTGHASGPYVGRLTTASTTEANKILLLK